MNGDGPRLFELAITHHRAGRFENARSAYSRIVAANPADGVALYHWGTLELQAGRPADALALFERALELQPGHPDASYQLGNALIALGRTRDAAAQYRLAASQRSDFAPALNNLGNVLRELGEFGEALTAYEAAIQARPGVAMPINNAGFLLHTLGRLEEAEAKLRHGLAVDPTYPTLHLNLGNVLKDGGDLDGAIEQYRRAISLDPNNPVAHSNLVYALSFRSFDGAPILAEARRWNQRHAMPVAGIPLAASGTFAARPFRPVGRRLRIGYVSPDFRDHCQALFLTPLLSNHDHGAFEVFCYSTVKHPDDLTRKFAGYADTWRDVHGLDDAALAVLIRSDDIDVLVDLTMHMAGGRPLVFARKPAPVQVAWLAYPGTTGLDAMEYRLSDPRLDPPGYESQYSERTVVLPDSFWCYDPLTREPPVNPLPALTRGFVTLGCLNNPCKLHDRALELWGRVLNALPDARLMLLAPPGKYRVRLQQRLATVGVAPDRVNFVGMQTRANYLRTYHEIDLGLDTLPYNGHTTSLDSFWMGVPVVTRTGNTCVGRAGLSQLYQLGLTGLAAETDEAFIATVISLASDRTTVAALRASLRARLESSPLMDGARFARNVEAAYRRMLDDCSSSGQKSIA